MSKTDSQGAASTPQEPVYAQRAQRVARHPGLELSLAVFSVLASAWMLVDTLAGTIKVFGNRAPSFDAMSGFLLSHLDGYVGVVVAGLASVLFAVAAFWLFRRLNAAVDSDAYKVPLQIGAGVAIVKTGALAVTTVGVALTPLLTIQRGVNVGPVYLYEFLPLILATALFGFVTWYLLKLMGKQQVGKLLSLVLLVATSVVFVVGLVAVIVKSHSSDNRPIPATGGSSWDQGSDDDEESTRSGSSGGVRVPSTRDNSSTSNPSRTCYEEYTESRDISAYSDCLQEATRDN